MAVKPWINPNAFMIPGVYVEQELRKVTIAQAGIYPSNRWTFMTTSDGLHHQLLFRSDNSICNRYIGAAVCVTTKPPINLCEDCEKFAAEIPFPNE